MANLGFLNLSNLTPAIYLSPHLIKNLTIIHFKSLFFLKMSIVGTANLTYIIPLALLKDGTNKPWTFTTVEFIKTRLAFKVFCNKPANTKGRKLVGTEMGLLDSFKRSYATKQKSLSRDFTVFILSIISFE